MRSDRRVMEVTQRRRQQPIPRRATVKSKTTPAPRRAGTTNRIPADRALQLIGDDPETMLTLIAFMERVIASRRSRRKTKRRR